MNLRQTHTVATLDVSPSAYNEIAAKLRAAGYDHVFGEGMMDMSGIGLFALPAREPGFAKPDNEHQVFFYEQDFYVLSNFSAFCIFVPAGDGIRYHFNTSEEAYHWLKFDHLAGRGVQRLIEDVKSAHEAFKLAQLHKDLRRPNWDDEKVEVMKRILREKADQHEYVRRKLLATGERELIEDSWRDDFWGWGPNRDGKNMLGKLWMQIRDELRGAA